MIDAGLKELEITVVNCEILSDEELITAIISNPLEWDSIEFYPKFVNQSEESFQEQILEVTICIDAIDHYRDSLSQGTYTKNIGIRGFPGNGKTWCIAYCALYNVPKDCVWLLQQW